MGYLCTCLRLTNRPSRLRQVKARICRQYTRNVIKQLQVAGIVPDYLVAQACCGVPFPSTFVPLFASTLSTFSGTLNVWPDLKKNLRTLLIIFDIVRRVPLILRVLLIPLSSQNTRTFENTRPVPLELTCNPSHQRRPSHLSTFFSRCHAANLLRRSSSAGDAYGVRRTHERAVTPRR